MLAMTAVLPYGIVPLSGVYASTDRGGCCWTTQHAAVRTVQPSQTDTILLELFVPPYALSGTNTAVQARIDGAPPQRRCCLRVGANELPFAVPFSNKPKTLTVALDIDKAFVPNDVIGNGDTRRLSVLLQGAAFENSLTGARFGDLNERASRRFPPRLALAVLIAAALIVLAGASWRPEVALYALVLSDAFDFTLPFGSTTITLPKVVLAASAIALLRHARRIRLPGRTARAVGIALGVLLGTLVLSSAAAVSKAAAAHEVFKWLEYAADFAVGYAVYRISGGAAHLVRALTLALLLVVADAVYEALVGATGGSTLLALGSHITRLSGTLEGPNQLAGYIGVIAPVLLACAVSSRSRALLVALGTGVLGLLATFSRGGITAFACGSVTVLTYARAQLRKTWLAALAVIFALGLTASVAAAAGILPHAERLFGSETDLAGGLGTRTLLWHEAFTLFRAHPWLGVGPGNFEVWTLRLAGVRTHANSVYLNTLAEGGLAGVTALAFLMITLTARFVRHARSPLELGVLGAIIVLALHQLVDTLWVYPKVGVLFWLLVAFAAASLDDREIVNLAAGTSEIHTRQPIV